MDFKNKKVIITGGAGFIGSRLAERLVELGARVGIVDNLMTGDGNNLERIKSKIKIVPLDVRDSGCDFGYKNSDFIFHLACPAATEVFTKHQEETVDICYSGTKRLLDAVKFNNIPIFFTSSSEVYGKKAFNVKEDDAGEVKFRGIRAAYDEGKRIAETLIYIYQKKYGMKIYTGRLFNTYGGRETPNGRLIPTVLKDCVTKKKICIYGNGKQIRTLNYIDDTIDGMFMVIERDYQGPINIGGEITMTVKEIAKKIPHILKTKVNYYSIPRPEDEPGKRKPDISLLKSFGYKPKYSFEQGIRATYNEMKEFNLI